MIYPKACLTRTARRCYNVAFILAALGSLLYVGTAQAFPTDGLCGSANGGSYSGAPATNLCTLGAPSSVTGIGPWFWSCVGIDGGTTATCTAAQSGGLVYRSSDAGVNWTAGTTGLAFNSGADALAVSPAYASDHTLFLGSTFGIHRSTDSGNTWTQVSSRYNALAFAVSPAYASDRTIFSGMSLAGVYKSTDGGSSWAATNSGFPSLQIRALAVSPAFATDRTLFAGIQGNGVYKSTDGGSIWTAANSGLSTTSPIAIVTSPNYVADSTVFAVTTDGSYSNGGPHYHLYKSTDGGVSWSTSDTGLTGSISEVRMSPAFASDQTMFVVTNGGIYKSYDGGNSWTQVNSSVNGTSLAVSPAYATDQTLFAALYGSNVFKSSNGGSSWNGSNSNLALVNHLNTVAVSPNYVSDRVVFAVTSLMGPSLQVSSGSLSFGSVTVSSSSTSQQLTIINGTLGDANLAISSISISGSAAGQFSISPGTCGSTTPVIPVGGSCTIEVTFTPGSAGSKSATITIVSNTPLFPSANVGLSGTGAAPTSTIASPSTGFSTQDTSVTVTGTAEFANGTVSLVEVSANGGTTWQPATGTTSWSINLFFPMAGTYTITSRATSSGGLVESPKSGTSVTIDRTPPTGSLALYFGTWTLNASDGGLVCIQVYPRICGSLEMSLNGTTWLPATTSPGTGGPLWLRDKADNQTIIYAGTLWNSNGGPIRIGATSYFYSSLQPAYDNAQTGEVIKLTTQSLLENLDLGRNATFTLRGGYDSSFTSSTGTTPVTGALTARDGVHMLENLQVNGTVTVEGGIVTPAGISIIGP